MMTREEILSIEEYCADHKISHKKRLEELGLFVQLASGRYVPQTMPPARTAMRIQGVMTPAHLRELIAAGNV